MIYKVKNWISFFPLIRVFFSLIRFFLLIRFFSILFTEKDVARTDRNYRFFEGDQNANVQMLMDVLMTYCMYNFDLGMFIIYII